MTVDHVAKIIFQTYKKFIYYIELKAIWKFVTLHSAVIIFNIMWASSSYNIKLVVVIKFY